MKTPQKQTNNQMLDPQEQNTVQDLNKKVTKQSSPCQTSNQNLIKKGSKNKKKTSYEQPNWWMSLDMNPLECVSTELSENTTQKEDKVEEGGRGR